jgi:hypothetical protein
VISYVEKCTKSEKMSTEGTACRRSGAPAERDCKHTGRNCNHTAKIGWPTHSANVYVTNLPHHIYAAEWLREPPSSGYGPRNLFWGPKIISVQFCRSKHFSCHTMTYTCTHRLPCHNRRVLGWMVGGYHHQLLFAHHHHL